MKLDIKKQQILLFFLVVFISLYIAFFACSDMTKYYLYGNLTYYIVSLAIFIWLIALYNIKPNINYLVKKINNHKTSVFITLLIIFCYIRICDFEYRILADETNLAATSKFLYEQHQTFLTAEQTNILLSFR